MTRDRLHFLLLNIGHFLDHLFTLIFATVAALALYREWNVPSGVPGSCRPRARFIYPGERGTL